MKDTLQQLSQKEGTYITMPTTNLIIPAVLSSALYHYLRGKSLNVLSTHSKEAEYLLSQAVKHNPLLVDAWNSLGESYWKAGNVTQAHHCFTGALSHVSGRGGVITWAWILCLLQEVNKESLRNLSMVLRQLGKG